MSRNLSDDRMKAALKFLYERRLAKAGLQADITIIKKQKTKRRRFHERFADFQNPQFGEVRVVQKDGEPWFVAADVCRVLEHTNVSQGYTKSATIPITHGDGSPDAKVHTYWTQKGRIFLWNILSARGILAVMDRTA